MKKNRKGSINIPAFAVAQIIFIGIIVTGFFSLVFPVITTDAYLRSGLQFELALAGSTLSFGENGSFYIVDAREFKEDFMIMANDNRISVLPDEENINIISSYSQLVVSTKEVEEGAKSFDKRSKINITIEDDKIKYG
ncbi:MAG: hypothetical protein PWR30_574 [Candidatus Woesearchaeota archaeon]|nr:hypothetical protein [Candidatus Woesearchaeota archaeon]